MYIITGTGYVVVEACSSATTNKNITANGNGVVIIVVIYIPAFKVFRL
jgi:hypothetical protein